MVSPEMNGNEKRGRTGPEDRWYPPGGWGDEGGSRWGELDSGSIELLRTEIEEFPSVKEAEASGESMLKIGDKVQFIDTDGEWIEGSAEVVDIRRNEENPEETYFLVKSATVEGFKHYTKVRPVEELERGVEETDELPEQISSLTRTMTGVVVDPGPETSPEKEGVLLARGSRVLFRAIREGKNMEGVVEDIFAELEEGSLKEVKFFAVRGEDGELYYLRRRDILGEIGDDRRAA